MARNIKSYIQKATLVFQEEGKEDIHIEVQVLMMKSGRVYEAHAPKIAGSKVSATEPAGAAKKAFEAAVAIIEKGKELGLG